MKINESSLTPTQRFWRLLKPDQKEIYNVYVYAIFNGLINLSVPLGIQAIVNLIQGGQINTSWIVLVCFVVFGVGLTGGLQLYQLRITENLQQKIFSRAAFEFAYRIPNLRMETLYRKYAPELMNRFFEVVSIQKGLSKVLIDFSTALLHMVFGLILLSFYHPFFILFSFILVLLVAAIFKFTAKKGLDTSLKESKHKFQVVHWLEELARTAITFKGAGKTDLPLQRTDKHVGDYLQARESHFSVLVKQYSLMVVFKVLVAASLLAIGGILVMNQQMNIGQFVGAEIIILLVMAAVEKLVLSLETIYDVLTALEKVGQVTDLPLESNQGGVILQPEGEEGIRLDLKAVQFAYPGISDLTLNGIDLSIKSGEKIVITGPNGSGKSTLLQVLAGLYKVSKGSVAYNGLTKGNLNLHALRSAIGHTTGTKLFQGTVLENIAMGRKEVSFEDVNKVIEALGLGDFVRNLPKGFNTVIGPQGVKLPLSVTNKLLLARGIAGKPGLLLVEDVLECLEGKERKVIIEYLMDKNKPWTLVAVSSDSQLAERADRVLIMEDGKIISSNESETEKLSLNN